MSKRITIDPITRLEGHGKIEIFLDDEGAVTDTFFQIPELRGFERFVVGRPIEELPRIVTRICGVCPASHHMASAKADNRYSLGSFDAFSGGGYPTAAMSKNANNSRFVQPIALIGSSYPQHYLLPIHGITLSQSPYLAFVLRQDLSQQRLDLFHTTEYPCPTREHFHSSYRIKALMT